MENLYIHEFEGKKNIEKSEYLSFKQPHGNKRRNCANNNSEN